MLKAKYIIKDIENNLIFGSGFVHTLTYDLGDKTYFRVTAEEETIDFKYLTNETIEVIKISIPYEMFWETETEVEILTSVIKTISKVGELGREQFSE